jgi:curved DNA-binding protein CbpA
MAAPPDAEGLDLDLETQRYVLELHGQLQRITHYELLGVPRDANKKTITRAYFRLVATLHPDRHFGKKLGSFKDKIELLFRRISEAHEALTSLERRAAYDATLGPASDAPRSAAPAVVVEAPRDAQARQAREEEARQRLAAAKASAQPHVAAALRAKAAGDLAAALAAYRAARTLLPDDKELEQAYLEVQRTFAERASEAFVRQALLEERHGHWAQAAITWKRVAAARPHDASVRERVANALARARGAG